MRSSWIQRACRRAIREGVLTSAHDCSDGGLAVALAECCIAGKTGFRGSFSISGRWDAALFGEDQSRIVASLSAEKQASLERICGEEGAEWCVLGHVGGESLSVDGQLDVGVKEIAERWGGGLEL